MNISNSLKREINSQFTIFFREIRFDIPTHASRADVAKDPPVHTNPFHLFDKFLTKLGFRKGQQVREYKINNTLSYLRYNLAKNCVYHLSPYQQPFLIAKGYIKALEFFFGRSFR